MATTAQILDGTAVSREMFADVAERAANFAAAQRRPPCLATVLIGDDPASHTYVRMKQRRAGQLGLESRRVQLPAGTSTEKAVAAVRALSEDGSVDGILVQHPAPQHVDELAVFEAIAPEKDVDGVTMHSFASMGLSADGFHSCTPEGIVRLLNAYELPISGKRVCVVGRSAILGKPVGLLLLARDATVTFCHSRTTDLAEEVAAADIVVAAVGRPGLVCGAWIKPGAVVIDAGYNPGNVGDVEFSAAATRASYITPVPGGVGPMTIAVLMEQTITAAENRVQPAGARS